MFIHLIIILISTFIIVIITMLLSNIIVSIMSPIPTLLLIICVSITILL